MSQFSSFVENLKTRLDDMGVFLVALDVTDSTNTRAKEYAADAADQSPVLFVAREQSAGRGRLGRDFVSRPEGGIYMTLLYFIRGDLADAVTVTTATAVAAARAIERVAGEKVGIKWVNDIYNDNGKVAGILVESLSVKNGYAVAVGIGINVGVSDFPPEIRDIASSLGALGANEKSDLAASICKGILDHAAHPENRGYMAQYRKLFILQGKIVDIYVSGEHSLRGTVDGVDDNGGLIVLHDGTKTVFSSGDITVRLMNN